MSSDEDSGRWDGFRFCEGDVVISTRTKHGTTWMQSICLLLIHGDPELLAPLAELSPWLDWRVEDLAEVVDRLDSQPHRRVIKTHTPLDGLPLDDRATYIVVARHPLDAAVSLRHQGDNLDRQRMLELSGTRPPSSLSAAGRNRPVDEWLSLWIDDDADPLQALDSLNGVFHHLNDAWARRHEPNVVLVHYQDLVDDLAGQMSRLADELGVDITDDGLSSLVSCARFEHMQAHADRFVPDRLGVIKDSWVCRGCG